MNETLSSEALRAHFGEPSPAAKGKVQPELSERHRTFVEASCFVVLATADAEGRMDVSPRGGAPGFVRVDHPSRLLIPDLSGNRRVDSMRNIAENPRIGLLFFVPGVNETLRVSGSARVRRASGSEASKTTGVFIEVSVEEAFHQCPKSLLRAEVWRRGADAAPSPPRMSSRRDEDYEL